jgi:predicted Zn finger-like uncharacterized protein
MILARCPHCDTTFRATAEKLKAKSGKVRCGQCKKAFNALEHLIEEIPDSPEPALPGFELVSPPAAPVAAEAPGPAPEAAPVDVIEASDTPVPADPLLEAQTAGLVAARDTRDVPGYSKWAEGTFSAGAANFEEPRRLRWPAALLLVVLGLMLGVQATYLYRTEISSHWPELRPWLEEACSNAGCTVPYPADPDQIDIQASELQIDPDRGGLLVLHLTLQNRSEFAQAYPAVELTLTDVREQVVVRKRLAPADWLPVKLEQPAAFPGRGEIASRLWIDPKDTGAVGYSLKVVY